MDVDATIFVLADYGYPYNLRSRPRVAYTAASFELDRDRELWPLLGLASDAMPEPCILRLPRGASCTTRDGIGPDTDGWDLGYLHEDSYGTPLRAYSVSSLPAWTERNGRIFDFIRELWPDGYYTIVWH